MNAKARLLENSADRLFDEAPCGFLSTRPDGSIIQVNRTLELWLGRSRAELLEMRFQDLLSSGGRIYYETHYAPLLLMQGSVREIAVEISRADGSYLPALVNSSLGAGEDGRPQVIRTTVFEATHRRRYEHELLRVAQRESEIAQQLQQSLLAGELPDSPCVEFEVAYSSAVSGTEVGGDWYDVFWLVEDRTIALVVGDVVGRGIAAAATMGQLRSAVRAFASTGLGPANILSALDEYSRRHCIGKLTTLVYAQLEIETGSLRFACAGHPPPIVLRGHGNPFLAWEGRSLPIGLSPSHSTRPETDLALTPGNVLVLYTDGLIEHGDRDNGDGTVQLVRELAGRRAQPFKGLAESVVQALRDPVMPDDMCLLAVQLAPAP